MQWGCLCMHAALLSLVYECVQQTLPCKCICWMQNQCLMCEPEAIFVPNTSQGTQGAMACPALMDPSSLVDMYIDQTIHIQRSYQGYQLMKSRQGATKRELDLISNAIVKYLHQTSTTLPTGPSSTTQTSPRTP